MKIAVLGAGAMGSLVGAFLVRGGADVILVDPYKEHMDTIRTKGLTMCINGKDSNQVINTCCSADEAGAVDVVICLVKSLYTKDVLVNAKALISSSTYVLTLQNGLGNAEAISEVVPKERILQGLMKITSQLNGPGSLTCNILEDVTAVHIGTMAGNEDAIEVASRLAEYWCEGGLKSEYHDNILDFIWGKAVNNVAVNSACAIARLNIGQFLNNVNGWSITDECIKEVINVAKAKGVELNYDTVIKSIKENTIPKFGNHYPSTAQDVKSERITEINTLNGAISKIGKEMGIKTPYNDCIASFVSVIQDNYTNMF